MNKATKMVLTLTAMLAAGCQDNAVAPRSDAPGQLVVSGGGTTADLTGGDTARFDFVIDPMRNTMIPLGAGNSITFPAHSLCDPALSTYGATEWDKPCPLANRMTTLHGKAWLDKNNNPRVDFSPHVRFAPSPIPDRWVVLTLSASNNYGLATAAILYCSDPTVGSTCVDEAKTDPSLVTFKDPATGQLKRRVKHFSGYSITTGEACDPSPDNPDCVGGSDGLMSRTPGNASFGKTAASTTTNVDAITRDHPLPDHPTKDAVIGVLGGELRLPQAGVTLIVPAGAVDRPTRFSITSVKGNFLAYEFEPHGAHFNVPLLLVQDLRGTSHRDGENVIGAYFADANQLDQAHGRARVDELINVTLNKALNQATLPIWHFSGYMMASGRDE